MLDPLSTEAGRELGRVADDDEVDVGPAAPQQKVAHGSTDEIDRDIGGGADRRQLRVRVRHRAAEVLGRLRVGDMAQVRTGMPASAMWRFASRTRYFP